MSKPKTPYIPRVMVTMNTGSRVIWSKKDKANRRANLNKQVRESY